MKGSLEYFRTAIPTHSDKRGLHQGMLYRIRICVCAYTYIAHGSQTGISVKCECNKKERIVERISSFGTIRSVNHGGMASSWKRSQASFRNDSGGYNVCNIEVPDGGLCLILGFCIELMDYQVCGDNN